MNDNDVLGVLIYANELDGRHAPNQAKVWAWKQVFDSAPAMDAEFVKNVIKRHYSITDEMVSPAKVMHAWNAHQRAKAEARMAFDGQDHEAHCGYKECRCTHTAPCFKGWMDSDDHTTPCPLCRSSLADVLLRIAPLGHRSDHDHSTIRSRTWADNDA